MKAPSIRFELFGHSHSKIETHPPTVQFIDNRIQFSPPLSWAPDPD